MAKKKRSRRRKTIRPQTKNTPKSIPGAASARKKEDAPSASQKRTKKTWLFSTAAVILVGAAALIFLILPGETPVQRNSQLNVLLITLDTTRADRLGCYGYRKAKTPHLDSLAEKGVRFENAYCQVPLTLPSHCSIMTGTNPVYHHVHNNGTYYLAPEYVTLAEVLKANGFKTAASVASFTVDSRFGLDQGFDFYDDNFQENSPFKALNSERPAEQVFTSFAGWLEKQHAEQFFCWIHFFDPHLPYNPPAPYRSDFPESPYDGEIAYMDAYVGAAVEKLKEKNILWKTLIILAGDHGEGLGEKGESGHGIFLYEAAMRVPLIFYAESIFPGGKVVSARARLIDIMPSILDLLGLPEDGQSQGTSLIPYIEGKKKDSHDAYIETYYPRENYGWSELTGVLSGDWKYIQAPKPELYNLKSDLDEEENEFLSNTKIASDMKRRLEALIEKTASSTVAGKRELSAQELERLRSLGYVDLSSSEVNDQLPDPKEKLDELRMVQQAEMFEFQGNFREAAELHEKILALRPSSPSSYINMALAQARMQDFEKAIQTLKRGTEIIPDSELLLSRLGHTYLVRGRLNEAFTTMQQVLALNPNYFDALTASAVIMDTLGKKTEAREYYERALAVEPENKFLRMSYALNLAMGGEIPEAIKIYTRLLQDYPEEYNLYQQLGIAHGMAGNYSEAIEYLTEVIYLHPTPTAYLNLAVAYKETGETAEAIRYLEKYLENPEGEEEVKIRSAQAELANLRRSIKK